MIDRVVNKYTFIMLLLLILHVVTVSLNGILSYFDFVIVVFILTLNFAEEDNFMRLSLLFGLFADFARDGLYGPNVAVFMIFYLVRFRADVMMDMSKAHYRLLLFYSMSFAYCMVNLMIMDYPMSAAVFIAVMRSAVNVGVIMGLTYFFKGLSGAFKNA